MPIELSIITAQRERRNQEVGGRLQDRCTGMRASRTSLRPGSERFCTVNMTPTIWSFCPLMMNPFGFICLSMVARSSTSGCQSRPSHRHQALHLRNELTPRRQGHHATGPAPVVERLPRHSDAPVTQVASHLAQKPLDHRGNSMGWSEEARRFHLVAVRNSGPIIRPANRSVGMGARRLRRDHNIAFHLFHGEERDA